MNLYFYCSSTRFKDSPEIILAWSAIKITIWFNIHEQYMLICTKSGNYFTKASLFKGSRSVKCISVVAMSCMCSHIAAANTRTKRRILKNALVSHVCVFCFAMVDQGEYRRTEATVVVKIHKQTNLLLSAPLKPVLLSCALLSLILLCFSVYHQRYFPAVHNRLTNHKKKHLLACFLVYCDTTSTH